MLEQHTEVQRAQHLTQSGKQVFGQSYIAQTSSVTGAQCFFRELTERSAVEYFQSFAHFYEPGLLVVLPARIERESSTKPTETAKRYALEDHQRNWIRERRTWLEKTNGLRLPMDLPTQHMYTKTVTCCSFVETMCCWQCMRYALSHPSWVSQAMALHATCTRQGT